MAPEFKNLQHLALKVRKIDKSIKFYCGILGFRTTESYRLDAEKGYQDSINFITCTNKHHVINLYQISEEYKPLKSSDPLNSRDTPVYGLHHFAFEVENKKSSTDKIKLYGVKSDGSRVIKVGDKWFQDVGITLKDEDKNFPEQAGKVSETRARTTVANTPFHSPDLGR